MVFVMNGFGEGLVQPLGFPHATLNPLRVEPRPAQGSNPHSTQKIPHLSMKDFCAESEGFEPPNL